MGSDANLALKKLLFTNSERRIFTVNNLETSLNKESKNTIPNFPDINSKFLNHQQYQVGDSDIQESYKMHR